MTTDITQTRYDLQSAERLAPLLQGIAFEIQERSRVIRAVRHRLGKICGPDGDLPREKGPRNEALELRARLATHLRERRIAQEELEELGCYLDESSRTVRIPGPSGTLEDGFLWSLMEESLQPVEMPPTAPC